MKHYSGLVTSTRQEGVQNVRNERLYWDGKAKEERAKWQREKESVVKEFQEQMADLKSSMAKMTIMVMNTTNKHYMTRAEYSVEIYIPHHTPKMPSFQSKYNQCQKAETVVQSADEQQVMLEELRKQLLQVEKDTQTARMDYYERSRISAMAHEERLKASKRDIEALTSELDRRTGEATTLQQSTLILKASIARLEKERDKIHTNLRQYQSAAEKKQVNDVVGHVTLGNGPPHNHKWCWLRYPPQKSCGTTRLMLTHTRMMMGRHWMLLATTSPVLCTTGNTKSQSASGRYQEGVSPRPKPSWGGSLNLGKRLPCVMSSRI